MTFSTDRRRDPRVGSSFAVLLRDVRDAGLLDRRLLNSLLRVVITVAGLAAAWGVFSVLGNSWWQLVTAAVLGILFTQVAFLGHDGGHQQILRGRRGNDLLSIVLGDLLLGLSFGWWVDKHNRHHAHPNHEGRDPDIADGVLAFVPEQIGTRNTRIGRFAGRHQAALFFPLLLGEGVNLHVASVRFLLAASQGRARRYRLVELTLFAMHAVGYVGALLLVLDPVQALVFFVVHQAVFGLYMGCSFAPNHKGMPTFAAGSDTDFLSRQVLTSRNVRGGWFVDLLLGGLNYQVEHHLFPNMPRTNLRKAQPIVRAYCQAHHVPYTETSLLGSYVMSLRHLRDVGAPLRPACAMSA